jgi:hypothetical protein
MAVGRGFAAILLVAACSAAPLGSPQADSSLPDGTRVTVRLLQFISSETSKTGDPIRFQVADDVQRDTNVLIKRGAPVTGTVVQAAPASFRPWIWTPRMRRGRLVLTIDRTTAIDGQLIRLRASPAKSTNGRGIGVNLATPTPRSVLRWAHHGTRFDAFVDGDYTIKQ